MKVLELASVGPGPFAAMVLADLGAEVVRVERVAPDAGGAAETLVLKPEHDLLNRGRPALGADLKDPRTVDLLLEIIANADVLLEGYRPGVAERLGLGPVACLASNPGLVYGRMTGWGQDGPLANSVGHDLDYIALSGALYPIGPADTPPVPPLNLLGDFGGGGMLLALGVVSGLLHARRSGQGQVVDAAMVDGSALLMTGIYGMMASGVWRPERESNLLDGSAHFYSTYETRDGRNVAVAAIEPRFYRALLGVLGIDEAGLPEQMDHRRWPELKRRFATAFRTRTQQEWVDAFAGTDACFAPVLTPSEAPLHPHNADRRTFVEIAGVVQPAPAPRFSVTPADDPTPPRRDIREALAVIARWGIPSKRLDTAEREGFVS